ncbi:hypothetical protein TRVA0_065S00298 [Trichomonascus vanleenenianus]|uniref:nonhemolytic phospholipases C family protein n=1 Tax=Trichomonascus vanleenenianus TaxID=2268995 RepID=UPI003EC9BFA7
MQLSFRLCFHSFVHRSLLNGHMLHIAEIVAFALLFSFGECGLEMISHVVLFMQENRSFDHYHGTMAGVRGFRDPNVQVNADGVSVFYQKSDRQNASEYLLPFHLSADPSYIESNQCIIAGSNDWTANHNAWNWGELNQWVTHNTPYSWGYYNRSDIPYHFEIAEAWTIGDMYAEAVIASTCPNRATWIAGTINAEGSPRGDPERNGGNYIDNYLTPGCQTTKNGMKYSCYPLNWKTIVDYLEEYNIDWYVYQQENDFSDNPFQWFTQFQARTAGRDPEKVKKALSFRGMEGFYEDARQGTLPSVSYVIGPFELSEHPPFRPVDGAYLLSNIVKAVMDGPKYNETVIFVSYDETGGFGDHVPLFTAPKNTPGEWLVDPMNTSQIVPTGPGFRVPFYAISPYTRGGYVFTEPADHNSQILFLEEWARAKFGTNFSQAIMNPWRRSHMSNLTNMFDFKKPDFSLPILSKVPSPRFDSKHVSQSTFDCEKKFKNRRKPPIPYGKQTEHRSLVAEKGFKKVRGQLTEGRYLVFEANNSTLSTTLSNGLSVLPACPMYSCISEQFIIEYADSSNIFSKEFFLKSAATGQYLGCNPHKIAKTSKHKQPLSIDFLSTGRYVVRNKDGYYLSTIADSTMVGFGSKPTHFNIYSVSY